MLAKRKLFTVTLLAVVIWIVWNWFRPVSPEERFRAQFSDLSVGVPEYQSFRRFSQPEYALKGDYCTADFIQSEPQFFQFVSRLKVSPSQILSSNNLWIRVDSHINPGYPWLLHVQARTGAIANTYEVHIEGQQPYD